MFGSLDSILRFARIASRLTSFARICVGSKSRSHPVHYYFSCTQNARTTATAEPALPKRVPAVLGPPLAAATSQVSAERCEAVVLRGPPPRRVPALLPLPLLLPLLLLLLRVALGLGLPKIGLSLSVCLPGLLVRRGLAWRAPQLEVDIVPGLVSRVSK